MDNAKQKTLGKRNLKFVSLTLVLVGFAALYIGIQSQDPVYQVGGVACLIFGSLSFLYYYVSKLT